MVVQPPVLRLPFVLPSFSLHPSSAITCQPTRPPPTRPLQKEREQQEKRKALYSIMTCMRDIRKRAERTDNMFEPLKDTVSLLHNFGIQLPDTVLQQVCGVHELLCKF